MDPIDTEENIDKYIRKQNILSVCCEYCCSSCKHRLREYGFLIIRKSTGGIEHRDGIDWQGLTRELDWIGKSSATPHR